MKLSIEDEEKVLHAMKGIINAQRRQRQQELFIDNQMDEILHILEIDKADLRRNNHERRKEDITK